MNPEQPFTPLFLTNDFFTYIKVIGTYENKTLPMTSSYNLTCFYPGMLVC